MSLNPARIDTARLVLTPISRELARAIVSGDVSAVSTGEGWPHDDTIDGLNMALARGHAAGWLVTLDGAVIGDCGVHREPNERGEVELGYGLAASYRGRGYGNELVASLSAWLLAQPSVARVIGRVLLGNTPSRRALEHAGFVVQSADQRHATYVLTAGQVREASGATRSPLS